MSMKKIATVTVGAGGAASIDFTSIAGTMTDLMIVVSGRSNTSAAGGGQSIRLRFNSNTTGYSSKALYGSGSYTGSYAPSGWAGQVSPSDTTASTFGNTVIYIPNYAGATNKSYSADSVTENNATAAYQEIDASLWANTSAVTQITLSVETGNFVQYSSATLYGITKGSLAGVTVS